MDKTKLFKQVLQILSMKKIIFLLLLIGLFNLSFASYNYTIQEDLEKQLPCDYPISPTLYDDYLKGQLKVRDYFKYYTNLFEDFNLIFYQTIPVINNDDFEDDSFIIDNLNLVDENSFSASELFGSWTLSTGDLHLYLESFQEYEGLNITTNNILLNFKNLLNLTNYSNIYFNVSNDYDLNYTLFDNSTQIFNFTHQEIENELISFENNKINELVYNNNYNLNGDENIFMIYHNGTLENISVGGGEPENYQFVGTGTTNHLTWLDVKNVATQNISAKCPSCLDTDYIEQYSSAGGSNYLYLNICPDSFGVGSVKVGSTTSTLGGSKAYVVQRTNGGDYSRWGWNYNRNTLLTWTCSNPSYVAPETTLNDTREYSYYFQKNEQELLSLQGLNKYDYNNKTLLQPNIENFLGVYFGANEYDIYSDNINNPNSLVFFTKDNEDYIILKYYANDTSNNYLINYASSLFYDENYNNGTFGTEDYFESYDLGIIIGSQNATIYDTFDKMTNTLYHEVSHAMHDYPFEQFTHNDTNIKISNNTLNLTYYNLKYFQNFSYLNLESTNNLFWTIDPLYWATYYDNYNKIEEMSVRILAYCTRETEEGNFIIDKNISNICNEINLSQRQEDFYDFELQNIKYSMVNDINLNSNTYEFCENANELIEQTENESERNGSLIETTIFLLIIFFSSSLMFLLFIVFSFSLLAFLFYRRFIRKKE